MNHSTLIARQKIQQKIRKINNISFAVTYWGHELQI